MVDSRGGVTPLYKPCRYLPPQSVWFLGLFRLKAGINVAHFGLESGKVFEEPILLERMHERSYRFNSKSIRTK